jgi:monovalent cation/hydrogen antiporter
LGGIGLGIISGFLLQLFSRRFLEPVLGVVFSFTIPYITFILASYLGVSGVLAVVVNGLIGSQVLLNHYSSLRRVLGYAFWDIFIILLNCFVFVLIGLQLRAVTAHISTKQMFIYSGYAFLIMLVMVAVRLIWVYSKTCIAYVIALSRLKPESICMQILREGTVIGWSGMRGIVSLAAAIGLPSSLHGRDVVIFITFVVILLTLLIPGLTLPSLICWLGLQHESQLTDSGKIREELTKIAEHKLHHLLNSKQITKMEYHFLKSYFATHTRVQEISSTTQSLSVEKARLLVIQAQRKKLLELWKRGELNDKLFTRLENELDLFEVTRARAEL